MKNSRQSINPYKELDTDVRITPQTSSLCYFVFYGGTESPDQEVIHLCPYPWILLRCCWVSTSINSRLYSHWSTVISCPVSHVLSPCTPGSSRSVRQKCHLEFPDSGLSLLKLCLRPWLSIPIRYSVQTSSSIYSSTWNPRCTITKSLKVEVGVRTRDWVDRLTTFWSYRISGPLLRTRRHPNRRTFSLGFNITESAPNKERVYFQIRTNSRVETFQFPGPRKIQRRSSRDSTEGTGG